MACLTIASQPITGFLIRSLIYAARYCIIAVTSYLDCHGIGLLERAARRSVRVVVFYDNLRCRRIPDNITLIHERNHYKHYLADGVVYARATSNLTWSELEGFSSNSVELEIVDDVNSIRGCKVSREVLLIVCSMFSSHPEAEEALRNTPCASLLGLCRRTSIMV